MYLRIKFILFWMLIIQFPGVMSSFDNNQDENQENQTQSIYASGLRVGSIGIFLVIGLLVMHFWLSKLQYPLQIDRRVNIAILGKQGINQRLSVYVIEVDDERFLIAQSPQQVICHPLHREVNWDGLNKPKNTETTELFSEKKNI